MLSICDTVCEAGAIWGRGAVLPICDKLCVSMEPYGGGGAVLSILDKQCGRQGGHAAFLTPSTRSRRTLWT